LVEFPDISNRIRQEMADLQNNRRLERLARAVAVYAPESRDQNQAGSVVFFRASTGILRMSLNTAFSVLASMGLRLAGVPAIHFMCRAGMSRCVQGTRKENARIPPPCRPCIAHSRRLFSHASRHEFTYTQGKDLAKELDELDISALGAFEYRGLPLGRLVMPSLAWILRRYHLPDDDPTRFLAREYILSAARIADEFSAFLERARPQAVVAFNGILYPEATVCWLARRLGIRTITHEVGFRPMSAFFTPGEATAYPIDIPDSFDLSPQENARLDAYLEKRFQGQFSMAGIRFWPEMHRLEDAFLERAARYRQVVPVFTNVIFDTSQVHAGTVFPDMFAWLDSVLEIVRAHPETLFVIRAHPDEMRMNKESLESVRDWVVHNQVAGLPNVAFFDSREYVNSYELIQRSKFSMVYNSTIGLEASILGSAVLCGGKARYTQYPIVFFPKTMPAYLQQAEEFLATDKIDIPSEFRRNARRFLFYQLYRTSLPFDDFLEEHPRPGFVELRSFPWQKLKPENSPTMRAIVDGVVNGGDFLMAEDPSF
jgi:hypothetical protein